MIRASKLQSSVRWTNCPWACFILGLTVLSFIGCKTSESDTVEFQSSDADWEMSDMPNQSGAGGDSSLSESSNPALESISKAFSGF